MFSGVTRYLILDNATAAIDFYKAALATIEVGEQTPMENGRVLNASIGDNGGLIMVMVPMPEHGHPALPLGSFNLHLQVDNADLWFERTVAAGCEITMPIELQFRGDRYGQFRDPFGLHWGFGAMAG